MTTSEILTDAPASGRRDTLVAALTHLHELGPGGHIVEVGATRNAKASACYADGWATRVFAWYASRTGGRVTTIDPTSRAYRATLAVCGRLAEYVTFHCQRAERVVGTLGPIDLLYMDGPSDAAVHLDIYRALTGKPRLVLWDDIILPDDPPGKWPKWPPAGQRGLWAIKGETAIPAMLADGYRLVFARERQVLLEWANHTSVV